MLNKRPIVDLADIDRHLCLTVGQTAELFSGNPISRAWAKRMKRNPSSRRLRARSSGRFSWPLALTLVALIVAGVLLIIFLRLETWPARTASQSVGELERLGKEVRAAFVDIAHLQPRVTINNRVYMEQTSPTSELAVVMRRMEVEHEFVHTWAGSSKRLKLNGTFIAKAGFDLRHNLSIDIRPDEIVVQLPHAEILDVAPEKVDVLEFENGFWNRISGEDVQNELSILPQLARQKANETNLPAEAEHALQRQLAERIHAPQPLRLIFTPMKKGE
jgi:hypothetical protein